MQPFTPAQREELLRTHSELSPVAIDTLEELLAIRASIDATSDPAYAALVDQRVTASIAAMPQYYEVLFGAARKDE